MKKRRTEEQIVRMLREASGSMPPLMRDHCRTTTGQSITTGIRSINV